MTIHKAVSSDIPKLCKLLNSLFTQEVEFAPNTKAQTDALRLIVENKELGEVFMIKDKDQIVGMVNLLYTVSTALGGKVGLIEDMVISSQYKAKGFGSKLLSHVVLYAKENGCKRLTLLTDRYNLDAQKFYHNHGFDESTMKAFRLLL